MEHLAWIQHQFLSGIRDSRKARSLWEMMRGVRGVRKSIHQSWLAKGLGLGLLCWGFKGVQEEIPSEEASTFQIGSVAFPPGQCTSPQLHPCHRIFDQDGYQDSSSPSLYCRPCFGYSLSQRLSSWDNWWDERGYVEGHWHAHTRGLPWGFPEVVGTAQQVHCSWRDYFEWDKSFMCVLSVKVAYEKCLETYRMLHLVYIYIYIYDKNKWISRTLTMGLKVIFRSLSIDKLS